MVHFLIPLNHLEFFLILNLLYNNLVIIMVIKSIKFIIEFIIMVMAFIVILNELDKKILVNYFNYQP